MQQGIVCCIDGIRGYGNPDAGIMIVGQNPAANEMSSGIPFSGNDGELLNGVLAACGWSRDLVYCTNSCCVRDLNRLPVCKSRLLKEIELYKPKLIVTLGAVACENLFNLKISKCRGALLYLNNSRGLATWLPSAILQAESVEKQNDYAAEFVRDIKKIARYFGPGKEPPTKVTQPAITVNAVTQAQAILDNLPRDRIVTLDIETPIIDKDAKEADPYHKILCVGIGLDDDVQYVFPEAILNQLVFPVDVKWGGWNLYGFDMVALRDRYGMQLPIAHDGMLTSYVRDERSTYGTHKLKHNAREDAGADFYETEPIREDPANLYKYNGLDCAYNLRLLKYHLSTFDEDDTKLYYDLLIPAANMYSEAQYNGMKIDPYAWYEAKNQFEATALALTLELVEEAKQLGYPGDINPNSDMQVAKLFFDILGVDPVEFSHKTKGGKWSVDKNVLDAINHPWAAKLRLHRQVTDTDSRYLRGVIAQVKHDGKIHPKCWIPGTPTGRPSYSDPPVQQLPHRRTIGDLARYVRSIFVPDSDDYILMAADYSQIELWMLYAFSNDENLHADLIEPWEVSGKPDYHSRTCLGTPCEEHYGQKNAECPACVKWEFDRDNQKHVNFGIPYGESAYGLRRPPPIGTGLPLRDCQLLIDKWYARNPGVLAWQKSIEYILRTTGFIKTPFGRKRRFPIVLSPKQVRQAINSPVQGTASDYTVSSAIELRPQLIQYNSRLLFTTHDEILLHVDRRYQQQVQELVQYVMEKPRVADFPSVKTEIKTGMNLYEVSP